MKNFRLIAQALLLGLFILSGCSSDPFEETLQDNTGGTGGSGGSSDTGSSTNTSGNSTTLDFTITMDSSDDTSYSYITETVPTNSSDDSYDDFIENSTFSSTVNIVYSGTTATVTNNVSGVTVTTDGAKVSVASTASNVNYVLSGTTTSGTFKVTSSTKKYEVTLNGVNITNTTGPAINLQSSKRAFIVCPAGTTNTLTDGSTYTAVGNEDQKGCFFTEGQAIFSGSGSLTVKGNYKHAICSDDYIRLRSGVNITVTSAVKDGIHTNDGLIIGGGTVTIAVSGSGIEVDEGSITMNNGVVTINSAGDAVKASYSGTETTITKNIAMNGGLLKLTTTGEKASGLNATGNITMAGGIIQATVSGAGSKGLTSDGTTTITAGKITAITSGIPVYEDNDLTGAAGIKSDGALTISGGTVQCKSTGNGGKGLSGDGVIAISGGIVKVNTTGQKYKYNSLDTSAKGIKADGNLTISGGAVMVRTEAGGSDGGSEGIESKATLTISGGEVAVSAPDDAINAAKAIVISGGKTYAYSSGNDGIDSNGSLSVSGGLAIASGTTQPEEGFDCDNNTLQITGGILIGTGGASSTMGGSQYSVAYGGSGTSGSYINIQSSDGTSLVTYKMPRTYSSMVFTFSCPSMKSGTKYTIYSGGSISGGTDFYGYYTGATYTKGTSLTTFTPSSVYTTVGNVSSGGGGGGGMGPGGR
jgi:hypothetical protein